MEGAQSFSCAAKDGCKAAALHRRGLLSIKHLAARPPNQRATQQAAALEASSQSSSSVILIGTSQRLFTCTIPRPGAAKASNVACHVDNSCALALAARRAGLHTFKKVRGRPAHNRMFLVMYSCMCVGQCERRIVSWISPRVTGTRLFELTVMYVPPGGGSRHQRRPVRSRRMKTSRLPQTLIVLMRR